MWNSVQIVQITKTLAFYPAFELSVEGTPGGWKLSPPPIAPWESTLTYKTQSPPPIRYLLSPPESGSLINL